MTATDLSILGITGSIGQSALKLVEAHPHRFNVVAVTAAENVQALAASARKAHAKIAVIANLEKYDELKQALSSTSIQPVAGQAALVEVAGMHKGCVLSAIVGLAALEPTYAAIQNGCKVALANKECLVAAGDFMLAEAKRCGATIIPVDSEHNAVFQVFSAAHAKAISRITLTASGGPFRNWSLEQMATATPEQAVKHPNWRMGAKISVDSASMMNKGLELIEAWRLFGLTPAHYHALVHPESIIHGLVHYADGSVLAQMSLPDMVTPLAHALAWPERIAAPVPTLDLAALGNLHFEHPDEKRFPALRLARQAMESGHSAPCVLNAANEVAVAQFLAGKIGFLDIATTVEQVLNALPMQNLDTLEAVMEADAEARRAALNP